MTKEIKIIKKKGGLMNRILARLHVFLSETLMTFFFSHHPFLRFSAFPYFCILQMMNPIHIFCTLYTPYIPTHMLFSHVCTLLCALVTVDTAYTIYFFLIHHCTNSLSSLHILVHHCTFCASLHILCITARENNPCIYQPSTLEKKISLTLHTHAINSG